MTNRIKLALLGVSSTLGVLTAGLAVRAQDYSASTTQAITDAGETVLSMFFTNLPIILGFVIAVILTLWGIRWILSQFHRGGKR
jgi:Kef-type K+ transport system membrane component KefB